MMQNGRMRTLLAILLVFTETALAVADDELPIPADEYVYCTVCHGVQLMGNPIIRAPRLSGMDSWYVENQLRAFKKGWRGKHEMDLIGMEMQPMAAALTDEQIKEVSAFVAATRSDAPPGTIDGDANKGRAYYSTCAACHGVRGEGNIALGSPALTGINDWYLVTQIRNFRDGTRGSHAGDTYGMQMRASARLLSDDEAIQDVVTYISTLQDQ
jgi:cytochrome c oxidase subunit 2